MKRNKTSQANTCCKIRGFILVEYLSFHVFRQGCFAGVTVWIADVIEPTEVEVTAFIKLGLDDQVMPHCPYCRLYPIRDLGTQNRTGPSSGAECYSVVILSTAG